MILPHDTNSPRDHPDWYIRAFEPPKSFFELMQSDYSDEYATLIIVGDIHQYEIGDGKREYDYEVFELPYVKRRDGLEDDIRENYFVWLDHARSFTFEREEIHRAVDDLIYSAKRKAVTDVG